MQHIPAGSLPRSTVQPWQGPRSSLYLNKWNPYLSNGKNNLSQIGKATINQGLFDNDTAKPAKLSGFNALAIRKPTYFEVSTADNPEMHTYLSDTLAAILESVTVKTPPAHAAALRSILHDEFTGFIADQRTSRDLIADLKHKLSHQLPKSVLHTLTTANRESFEQHTRHALLQWENLRLTYLLHDVPFIESISTPGQTDAVFFTDVGKQINNDMLLASFHNSRRKDEELTMYVISKSLGLNPVKLVNADGKPAPFEGGDIRKGPDQTYFIGHGFRTDKQVETSIGLAYIVDTCPVQNTNFDVYHIDCWFNPLDESHALLWVGDPDARATTQRDRRKLEDRFGKDNILYLSKEETMNFATNSVVIDRKIFVNSNSFSTATKAKLAAWGYTIVETDYSAFHASGGSVRCSTNELRIDNMIKNKLLSSQVRATLARRNALLQLGVDPAKLDALQQKSDLMLEANLSKPLPLAASERARIPVSRMDAEDVHQLVSNLDKGFTQYFPNKEW